MFARFNRRFKDGKEHRYWNIVESKRCAGGKVVQRCPQFTDAASICATDGGPDLVFVGNF
jgi:hypothetical protein